MVRTGLGYDIHRLVKGKKLIIGGLRVPSALGCLAHSDGDPLLHAIIDALLGAASLGDIGEHFPDSDKRYKGISSMQLAKKVYMLVKKKGFSIEHIDTNVILERPKLVRYKQQIRKSIAGIFSLAIDQVNVKAKTKEGLGSEGASMAISAQAVVTLIK